MDGHEGCTIQDRQDVKEMDPYDEARHWGAHRGGDQPTGAKSINAASADVVQSGEIVIRVGTIGCSRLTASSVAASLQGFMWFQGIWTRI